MSFKQKGSTARSTPDSRLETQDSRLKTRRGRCHFHPSLQASSARLDSRTAISGSPVCPWTAGADLVSFLKLVPEPYRSPMCLNLPLTPRSPWHAIVRMHEGRCCAKPRVSATMPALRVAASPQPVVRKRSHPQAPDRSGDVRSRRCLVLLGLGQSRWAPLALPRPPPHPFT